MTASNYSVPPNSDNNPKENAEPIQVAARSRPILTIMCLGTLAVCAAVLTLSAAYLYLNPQIPDASTYRNVQLETPLRILSQEGDLLAEFGERRLIPVGMDQVPDLFVRALVDTEDKRFYSHQGVDFISLLNDAFQLVVSQDIAGGASTLTMQLARNVSFSLEQRFIRKFKEMLLAMKIERQLSKDEILNLYINLVPFGKRAYGAEAAAQTYYNKSLKDLDLAQLAMLAGIPQAPSAANPINGPERALSRRNLVLARMLAEGSITQAEHDIAAAQPITAQIRRQSFDSAAPYPAEIVRQELLPRYPDLYTGGYSVITTINSRLQKQAVAALRRGLHGYDERHGYRSSVVNISVDEQPQLVEPLRALDEAINTEIASRAAESTADPSTQLMAAIELPVLPALPAELVTQLSSEIDKQPLLGDTLAGVVVAVGERSIAVALSTSMSSLAPNQQVLQIVPWDGLSWARKFISVESMGPPPGSAAEIVTRGDLVALRIDPANPQRLRLAEEPQVQGALVSLEPATGAIRALTGGYDFSRNQFNHAVQARRQPGSGFKPFVYSAALAKGITAASIYMDAPIVLDDEGLETQYRPDNNNNRYNGPTRLREALYRSINLVSIRVLLDVGAGRALRHVARFGFDTSDFPRNTQLGVGGGTMGVTPMEMARAYSVFANGGQLITPHLITAVRRNDKVLETRSYPAVCTADCERQTSLDETAEDPTAANAQPEYAPRVLDQDNAWLMHTMLQDVIKRGTGRRAAELERLDLAGKTGTTNEAADTWFNGYSPSLATSVWVGFSDYRPLGPREFGSTTPLPIWIDYMREALRDVPEIQLEQPETVVSLKIDPETGRIARPGAANAIFEYFLENSRPEQELNEIPALYDSDRAVEAIDTTDLF